MTTGDDKSERDDTIERMVKLVRTGELPVFVRRASQIDAADLADVLSALEDQERVAAVEALPPEVSSHALAEMPEDAHAGETLAALPPGRAAEIVEELEDDDAADILGELPVADQERILQEVEDRADVDRLLRYDDETAGGLMTAHTVTVLDTDTVQQALEEIRRQAEEVTDFYQIFVVDRDRRLVGLLPFKDLVISRPDRIVGTFMADADITVPPTLDQEEVARLMARYNLPSVAVVDEGGRLLGRVTFDDVIDVVEAETTKTCSSSAACRPTRNWRPGGTSRCGVVSRGCTSTSPRHFWPERSSILPGHCAAHRRPWPSGCR